MDKIKDGVVNNMFRNLAKRWAALSFNRSDPHCYARTLLHLQRGLIDFTELRADLEAKEPTR